MGKPQLPPEALTKLNAFLRAADTTVWHEADWHRFYSFIRTCQTTAAQCSAGDIARLLEEKGVNKQDALEAASVYYHGRAVLQQHD
jgi:hypothetical protein